jgi:hypothetical protein
VANFRHFAKNTWEREYSTANSQFFKQKIFANKINFQFKISKFGIVAYNMRKGAYDFLFSYFEYR